MDRTLSASLAPNPVDHRPRARRDGDLASLAYARIEEAIVTLEFEPGSTLSEERISEKIGIGRTPVRLALRQLMLQGLVEVMPQQGVRICAIDLVQQFQVLEVRREVDRVLARAAAQRATPEQRREFVRLAEQFDDIAVRRDEIRFLRIDAEFNALELSAARNPVAERVVAMLQPLARRFWHYHYQRNADVARAARVHADLARAIAASDAQASAAASDALIDFIHSFSHDTLREHL
jgi:DNA-binding GntR family transcriptional regulator